MKLKLLFVGRAKNPSLASLEADYLARLSHYVATSLELVKDGRSENSAQKIIEEEKSLGARLDKSDWVILLDEAGRTLSSKALSHLLGQWMARGIRNCVFVVGGSYGVSETIKQRANLSLSLSSLTLPHELARVVLLEALYRSHTLLRGEKYHH